MLSASSDYDTNRQLRTDSTGSGAGYLTIDLKFRRELEDLQLSLEPTYTLRRFTDSRYGNGDDRTVSAGMIWTGERSALNLSASYLDQSTLTSEVFETGMNAAVVKLASWIAFNSTDSLNGFVRNSTAPAFMAWTVTGTSP